MDREQFTVAAAQAEPVYHDKAGTVDEACRWIERAGDEGADLVVFPEAFVPGYPHWQGRVSTPRWSELMVELQKNSLHVDDDAVEVLGDAVAEAGVHVALGANERSDRPGSETLYNAIFYFDRAGDLVGRHRKLMPTHGERTVWGRGDPSSLATYETDIGTLGGLICYENHMTLSKAALTAMGEEIHAALWPGFWEQNGHPGDTVRADTSEAVDTCDIYPAMREYAFETQSFVVACSPYMSEDVAAAFPDGELDANVAAGGSMLVNPAGIVEAGPLVGEDGLLTAEFRRDERRAMKAYFDAMGHYSRWDAVSLDVSAERLDPITNKHERAPDHEEHDVGLSAAEAQAIADEYDVPIEVIEAVAAALAP